MNDTAAPRSAMPAAFAALHADARAQLSRWSPPTPRLGATRRRMLDVLAADETAMWRRHSRAHFTASLVVLSPALDEVALTLHAKAKRWFQFGGHFEEHDLGVADAAAREGREESGLADLAVLPGLVQVDTHELPAVFTWCREHLDLRFAAVAPASALRISDESEDVRWWPVSRLPEGTDPSLRQAVALAVRAASTGGGSAR